MAVSVSVVHPQTFESDERQREAIEHVHGPLLVVAGAGTGKTTVLTRRIARLIRDGHARPDEILAVTYTKNSAEEMRERVNGELRGVDLSGLQVGTFHEYCNRILIDCGRQFGVLDDKDLWIYLRKRIRELRLNYFVRAADVGKFLFDLLDFMRRCQDELVGPEKYVAYVQRVERGELPIPRVSKAKAEDAITDDEALGRCREIASVFATVERMLREENLGTFGHMITHAYELLRSDPDQLQRQRAAARFILVDEFQDANFAQVKILQMLAGEARNIFAVGDPDQAIYQFRGASSAAFELFQRNFPGARLLALEKNRRSRTPILQCAFAHVSKNPAILSSGLISNYQRTPLISARDEDALREGAALPAGPVEAVVSVGKEVEPADVVMTIRQLRRETRCKWQDFAILYRQHSHRDEVVKELAQEGIPFSIENMDVIDTPEVRDLLACLGAVVTEKDGASLFRVAALPQFTIDPNQLRAGMSALPRNSDSGSIASVLAQIEGGAAVLEALRQARQEIAGVNAKTRAAAEIIIRRFGLDRASRALLAVLEFVAAWEAKAITKTKELGEFLEYLEYFRECGGAIPLTSRDEDAVSLMTAHTAKGLEWNHVLILRANSGSFPCGYKAPLFEFPRELRDDDSVSRDEGKTLHDQEERRLFYVAMTRARDSLAIYARQGRGKTNPNPAGFVRELIEDKKLARWLRKREAHAFAGDLFGQASPATVPSISRAGEWLELAPARNLNERLSATAVETYETCPLQFKLEREWKIPSEVPAAMQYGAAIHRVLRTYYDYQRSQRTISDEELIELFRADIANAGIQDRYQYELYEQQGTEQLRDFLAAARRGDPPNVLHTEEWFEMKVGSAVVVGRIDRIDQGRADRLSGGVVITDYKTGKPKSQEDADESLQLSIYALAAREKWGYNPSFLIFYNVGESSPVITRRLDAQLQEARRKVEEVAAQIAEGNFTAKPGFHCNFCPYHNLCPATEKRFYAIAAEKESGRNPKRSRRSS